jgi:hypothetical protein
MSTPNPFGNGSAGSLTQIANAIQAQSLQNQFSQAIFNGWLAGVSSLALTAAEQAANVAPVDFSFSPGPFIDPRRYGFATNASGTTNSTALQNAILVATQSGGLIVIPPGIYAIGSTIKMHPNVTIWGVGCGDSSTIGAATRATILQPTSSFTGTDIIRADPADFGTDVYCRGVSLSNFMIDMGNVTSVSSLVAIHLKSVSDNPVFENMRVWNMGATHVALQVGVSANSGALLSDGTIFENLVTLTSAIDTYTGSMVILEDCNEMTLRDGKILSRSNGSPQSTSIGIQIKSTAIGCQGITIDAVSVGGMNAAIESTATGGGVGARWVRVLNGTFETNKFGIFATGTVSLPSQFWTVMGNRFISAVAGGSNVTLDFASNCTIIVDEFSTTTNVTLTANATGNTVWAQLAGVVNNAPAANNNVIYGRNGAEMQFTGLQTTEGTFTLTNSAGVSGSPTGTARYTQLGNTVTMFIPQIQGTASGTTVSFSGIPAAIRPTRQQICGMLVANNSLDVPGYIRINTDGTALLFCTISGSTTGTFTGSGTQGTEACAINYSLI